MERAIGGKCGKTTRRECSLPCFGIHCPIVTILMSLIAQKRRGAKAEWLLSDIGMPIHIMEEWHLKKMAIFLMASLKALIGQVLIFCPKLHSKLSRLTLCQFLRIFVRVQLTNDHRSSISIISAFAHHLDIVCIWYNPISPVKVGVSCDHFYFNQEPIYNAWHLRLLLEMEVAVELGKKWWQ